MTPTLTETVDILNDIDREYSRLARLTLSTMQHLLSEQADAVAKRPSTGGGSGSGDHDVMLARLAALAPYAYRGRLITDAITVAQRSLKDWQRALDEAISDRPPRSDERPRCAGTTPDRDGRLGGCGNLTEQYHEGGKVKYRPVCKKCRTQSRQA